MGRALESSWKCVALALSLIWNIGARAPARACHFQAHERALALFVNERHSFKEEKAMQFSKNNYHIVHLEEKLNVK